MGLNFRNCHPETSLSKVIRIVEEMSAGKRDSALSNNRILRAPRRLGELPGCMESTQDVEHIRKLVGQKRLLD
jgi:DUF438 domain-containing protein